MADAELTFSGDNIQCRAGETINYTVRIMNNPGLTAFMVTLVSDSEYISFSKTAKRGDFTDTGSIIPGSGGERQNVAWFNVDPVYGNGSLFIVKLTVAENTPAGAYPITLLCPEGDTIDGQLRELSPITVAGSVTVLPSDKPSVDDPLDEPPADDPSDKPPTDDPQDNPFADVSPDSVFYDAILWAYYHKPCQITSGYTATEFRPNAPCTRGQVVTFLWRAAGCPETKVCDNPFTDVYTSSPYYKAILWASEHEITAGYPDGTFRPNNSCTRAQFVTFLWRYENKPATSGTTDAFKDATSIARPYQIAVAWAVEKHITSGYEDGTFRPNNTCSRAHVVTFIFRSYKTA